MIPTCDKNCIWVIRDLLLRVVFDKRSSHHLCDHDLFSWSMPSRWQSTCRCVCGAVPFVCVSSCVSVCLCLCICVSLSVYLCLYMCTLWLRDQCHGLDQTRVFSSLGQDSNGKIEGSTSVAFLTIHMKFQYETFYPFTNLKQRKRPCLGENRPKFAAKRKSWRVVTSAIVGFNYAW